MFDFEEKLPTTVTQVSEVCKMPPRHLNIELYAMNIDNKVVPVFAVGGVTYTEEDEAIEAMKKLMLHVKAKWKNFIAKNYE